MEICGTLTEQEVVDIVRSSELGHESDSGDFVIEHQSKAAHVGASLAAAERFFVGEGNAVEVLAHFHTLQNSLSASRFGKGKQRKLTDFFIIPSHYHHPSTRLVANKRAVFTFSVLFKVFPGPRELRINGLRLYNLKYRDSSVAKGGAGSHHSSAAFRGTASP